MTILLKSTQSKSFSKREAMNKNLASGLNTYSDVTELEARYGCALLAVNQEMANGKGKSLCKARLLI